MKGLRWQWLVALGVLVAGTIAAVALGDGTIAKLLGGAVVGMLGPARAGAQ